MKVHTLKSVEPFWTDVNEGRKTFEVRRNDRDFRVGDVLELVNTADPSRKLRRRVVYVIYLEACASHGLLLTGWSRPLVPVPVIPSVSPLPFDLGRGPVVLGLSSTWFD